MAQGTSPAYGVYRGTSSIGTAVTLTFGPSRLGPTLPLLQAEFNDGGCTGNLGFVGKLGDGPEPTFTIVSPAEPQAISIRGRFQDGGKAAGTFVCRGAERSWSAILTDPLPDGTGGPVSAQPTAVPVAFCQTGETPAFRDKLADLKAQVGEPMGDPLECAHPDPASGDTVQRTTTGLAYIRASTGIVTFTNGGHRWALTPSGLLEWDGPELDPPATTANQTPPSPTTPSLPIGDRQAGALRALTDDLTDDDTCYKLGQADAAQDQAAGVPLKLAPVAVPPQFPNGRGPVRLSGTSGGVFYNLIAWVETDRSIKAEASVSGSPQSTRCGLAYLDGYRGAPFKPPYPTN
ncbi:MAG: hypothetical protein U0893_00335 [Chloroflexota bacterium]